MAASDPVAPWPARERRGYTITHPPFEEGNEAAVTHGARSDRLVRPVAEELLVWSKHLAEVAPWACGPGNASTVASWAWAEARCVMVREWLDARLVVDDAGEVPTAAVYLEKLERRAQTLRAELGLSPASLTKLLSGLSSIDAPAAQSGLEALRAAGAAIRGAAERHPPPELDAAVDAERADP